MSTNLGLNYMVKLDLIDQLSLAWDGSWANTDPMVGKSPGPKRFPSEGIVRLWTIPSQAQSWFDNTLSK